MAQRLTICHLYPNLMDTYGDRGNIITLQKRCEWRKIEAEILTCSLNEPLPEADIYFFGGGQDRAQIIVGKDLLKKSTNLKKTVEDGAVLLSICGGYQLLQKYFKTKEGKVIEGIGLFDAHTVGSEDRMIQNLLIEINPDLVKEIKNIYPGNHSRSEQGSSLAHSGSEQLIGFENHSGKTYLAKGVQPLGTVLSGAGNNGEDKTEGAVYKNAFGCYLHGSLLPKNPHFADYLIQKALERKYKKVKLKPLDDSTEWQAHKAAINRTRSAS